MLDVHDNAALALAVAFVTAHGPGVFDVAGGVVTVSVTATSCLTTQVYLRQFTSRARYAANRPSLLQFYELRDGQPCNYRYMVK